MLNNDTIMRESMFLWYKCKEAFVLYYFWEGKYRGLKCFVFKKPVKCSFGQMIVVVFSLTQYASLFPSTISFLARLESLMSY